MLQLTIILVRPTGIYGIERGRQINITTSGLFPFVVNDAMIKTKEIH